MTNEEFLSLKKGDQVLYSGSVDSLYGIKRGHLLTRGESWMDDHLTIEFTYDSNGEQQAHFFGVEDVLPKE